MPIRFEDLTPAQQAQVKLMYQNNLLTIEDYLYNFDEHGKYTGRKIAPVDPAEEITPEPVDPAEEITPKKKARRK